MQIFKCEAQGDVLYFDAKDQNEALKKLTDLCGPIPPQILTWTVVKKAPAGAEVL